MSEVFVYYLNITMLYRDQTGEMGEADPHLVVPGGILQQTSLSEDCNVVVGENFFSNQEDGDSQFWQFSCSIESPTLLDTDNLSHQIMNSSVVQDLGQDAEVVFSQPSCMPKPKAKQKRMAALFMGEDYKTHKFSRPVQITKKVDRVVDHHIEKRNMSWAKQIFAGEWKNTEEALNTQFEMLLDLSIYAAASPQARLARKAMGDMLPSCLNLAYQQGLISESAYQNIWNKPDAPYLKVMVLRYLSHSKHVYQQLNKLAQSQDDFVKAEALRQICMMDHAPLYARAKEYVDAWTNHQTNNQRSFHNIMALQNIIKFNKVAMLTLQSPKHLEINKKINCEKGSDGQTFAERHFQAANQFLQKEASPAKILVTWHSPWQMMFKPDAGVRGVFLNDFDTILVYSSVAEDALQNPEELNHELIHEFVHNHQPAPGSLSSAQTKLNEAITETLARQITGGKTYTGEQAYEPEVRLLQGLVNNILDERDFHFDQWLKASINNSPQENYQDLTHLFYGSHASSDKNLFVQKLFDSQIEEVMAFCQNEPNKEKRLAKLDSVVKAAVKQLQKDVAAAKAVSSV